MRKTSVLVYNQIKEEGTLSKRRWETYDALFRSGPMTINETLKCLPYSQHKSISPRFAELRDMGAIEEVGERECFVTGRVCILWDVSGKLPKKLVKPDKIECTYCNGRGYVQQDKLF